MSTARDRALVNLLLRRGLLTPGALARVQASRQPQQGLAEALAVAGVAHPDSLRALQDELRMCSWECRPCQRRLGWDELERLDLLACPACGQGLQCLPPHGSAADSAPTQRARSSSLGPTPDYSGRSIGPYELVRELGRGSNGVVYLGRRPGIERFLAVKILRDADQADEETVARFRLEAAVASKLTHPGIAAVHDVGWDGGHLYYAMDYVKGPTLKERLREGPLENAEAGVLIGRLARALAHAHEAGVIHRDIKPANVILEEESGKPRIMDFGLARDRSLLRSMTQSGDVIGTPFYMSPEQFRGEKSLDHRADIYALGAIFYEALAGQRPYTATSALELAEKVIRGDPPPPSQVREGVSPRLEAICLKAMATQADDRYPTAAALRNDIEQALRDEKRTTPARVSRPAGRAGVVIASVAVLAVGVGGALAVLLSARDEGAQPPPATAGAESDTAALLEQAQNLLRKQALLEEATAPYPEVRALLERAARPREGRPADADAALMLAEYLLRRGQAELALAELDQLEPSPRGQLLRGRAEEERGKLIAAREAWSATRKADPDGPWGAAAAAALARDAGQRDEALVALAHVEPTPPVLLEQGRSLLGGDPHQRDQAQLAFERLAQLTPDDPAAQLGLADLRLRQGKPELAEHSLERAFALTNPYPYRPGLLIRARLHLLMEQYERVLEDCDQALTIAPADIAGLTLRGLARLGLEDPEGARADLEDAGLADEDRQRRVLGLVDPALAQRARALFAPKPDPAASPSPRPSRPNPSVPSSPGEFTLGSLPTDLEAALEARVAPIDAPPARAALLKGLRQAARGAPWPEVRQELWRASELAPDSLQVLTEQLWVCLGRSQIADVNDRLEVARRRGWNSRWLELIRADLAWRRGDAGEAAMGFRSLAGGDDAPAKAAGALLAFLEGDDAAAARAADEALALEPDCLPARVTKALTSCLAGSDECASTYDRIGLLDARLLVHFNLSVVHNPLAALQTMNIVQDPIFERFYEDAVDLNYLLLDLVLRVETEDAAASTMFKSMLQSMMATAPATPDSTGYELLIQARRAGRSATSKEALTAWRKALEANPGLGVPEPDRKQLLSRFPRDRGIKALWGE